MRKIPFILLLVSLLQFFNGQAQNTIDTTRLRTVVITESALFAGTLIGLGTMWYDEKDRSSFHFFNDNAEWKQLDKAGHFFAAYNAGYFGMQALEWAGVEGKKKVFYGGSLGLAFLTTVEIFDGFGKKWGFSWGDMAANFAGTGLVIGQELAFSDQPVRIKFSYHDNQIPTYRKDVLGENLMQQLIKDYNGQTYWASINLKSLTGEDVFPAWLNLAIGYGATGMPSARSNKIKIGEKEYIFEQYRQYYLSFDIALEKIKSNSGFLNALLKSFSVLKVPFPTLEYNQKNGIRFYPIYF